MPLAGVQPGDVGGQRDWDVLVDGDGGQAVGGGCQAVGGGRDRGGGRGLGECEDGQQEEQGEPGFHCGEVEQGIGAGLVPQFTF